MAGCKGEHKVRATFDCDEDKVCVAEVGGAHKGVQRNGELARSGLHHATGLGGSDILINHIPCKPVSDANTTSNTNCSGGAAIAAAADISMPLLLLLQFTTSCCCCCFWGSSGSAAGMEITSTRGWVDAVTSTVTHLQPLLVGGECCMGWKECDVKWVAAAAISSGSQQQLHVASPWHHHQLCTRTVNIVLVLQDRAGQAPSGRCWLQVPRPHENSNSLRGGERPA